MPYSLTKITAPWFLGLCLLAVAHAQQPAPDDTAQGVQFYQQGRDKEALDTLKRATKRNKNDLTAWHYTALTLERLNKPNDARKAHEKAAKLGENLLNAQFEIADKENLSVALQTIKPRLEQAAVSAERYLALSDKPSRKKIDEWRQRADYLRDFTQVSAGKIYSAGDVTKKAVIVSKPEPDYTEEARRNNVEGVVSLRVLLGADGRVRAIRVLRGMPYGLTNTAVAAARRIRFRPAVKDGVSVSQWVQLEYHFNLY
jgi:TonB family protein